MSCLIFKPVRYRDFSCFKLGQCVAMAQYGGAYSIGTVTKIETLVHSDWNETYLRMEIAVNSQYDSYKRSQGVTSEKSTIIVSEYYERPILTQDQFETKENLKMRGQKC